MLPTIPAGRQGKAGAAVFELPSASYGSEVGQTIAFRRLPEPVRPQKSLVCPTTLLGEACGIPSAQPPRVRSRHPPAPRLEEFETGGVTSDFFPFYSPRSASTSRRAG